MTKRVAASKRKNIDWQNAVLPLARDIVEGYTTSVTLRQLFYRLVSLPHGHPGRISNTDNAYTGLSRCTADAREDGTFPELLDRGAEIHPSGGDESPQEAIQSARDYYRRDHTEGQPYQLWLGSEKVGMLEQIQTWFADQGVATIALGGQATKGTIDALARRVRRDGRPAILLYAGDHDPSGWRILQSFVDRTGWWVNPELPEWNPAEMRPDRGRVRNRRGRMVPVPNYDRYRKYRVALQPEQCDGLARNAAKVKDGNLPAFLANFAHTLTADEVDAGSGVQIEMDALDPDELRRLFTDAVERFWDDDAYQAALDAEEDDIAELDRIIANLDGGGG